MRGCSGLTHSTRCAAPGGCFLYSAVAHVGCNDIGVGVDASVDEPGGAVGDDGHQRQWVQVLRRMGR